MTRHLGYFIHHTIKPLIEELDNLLEKCEHLDLSKIDLEYTLKQLISLELQKAFLYCVTYVFIAIFLCLAIYRICS